MVEMDEEMGRRGVEKEEIGHTWEQEIRPTVFTARWLTHFLSLIYMLGQKAHSCLLSGKLVWQCGGGVGGTVAEIGDRKWCLAFRSSCVLSFSVLWRSTAC